MNLQAELVKLNLKLPAAPKPVAAYIPSVRSGNVVYISGQLPRIEGLPAIEGSVPGQVSVEQAQEAARRCVLNALAILDREIEGDWSRLVRIVKIGVFVNSEQGFDRQHEVANGASQLLQQVLGERGRHARFAVGAFGLPLNAAVEVEMTAEVQA